MPRHEHLPLEALETFVMIADLDGDAATAAERLGITQPSISKRLASLRRATSEPDGEPWLLLKGKRWLVTAEGQRVREVVSHLVQRYRLVEQFVGRESRGRPFVSIACGQQAAPGFVKTAVEKFLKDDPDCQLRLSTPRGRARIEGVAGGKFDLAVVTDSPSAIRQIARVDLYVESLFEDRFVLVANPSTRAAWSEQWHALPTDRPVVAKDLVGLPFVLPEPDAGRRAQFDEWMHRATGRAVDVVLETGGWSTILDFALGGSGVGFLTQSTLDGHQGRKPGHAVTRSLNQKDFPPDAVRLIARKSHGKDAPDLSDHATRLRRHISDACREID